MTRWSDLSDEVLAWLDPHECHKISYTSPKVARRAHKTAHWRVRVYWCDEGCQAWHVTNTEKIGD